MSGIWAARRARAQRGPSQCSTWPSQVVSWAHRAHGSVAQALPAPREQRHLLSKVLVFTLNTYLRHCICMYRACIGMYPGARPKSLCDDTIPVDTREIHHDTTYRTPAPSPPDPIHRYTLDTIQIQSIYMYLASRPLLAAASGTKGV